MIARYRKRPEESDAQGEAVKVCRGEHDQPDGSCEDAPSDKEGVQHGVISLSTGADQDNRKNGTRVNPALGDDDVVWVEHANASGRTRSEDNGKGNGVFLRDRTAGLPY